MTPRELLECAAVAFANFRDGSPELRACAGELLAQAATQYARPTGAGSDEIAEVRANERKRWASAFRVRAHHTEDATWAIAASCLEEEVSS